MALRKIQQEQDCAIAHEFEIFGTIEYCSLQNAINIATAMR